MTKKGLIVCFVLSVIFAACKNDVTTAGTSALPESDAVLVSTDTFGLSSQLQELPFIFSAPDSFLIGEADTKFGTIHADLLTQLACPVGYKYPEGSQVDSAFIYLYYNSWWGDGLSPLSLAVHEMDKATFDYSTPYSTDIDLKDYCSQTEEWYMLREPRIVVAANATDSLYSSSANSYVPYIRMRLNDKYAQKMFALDAFSSQKAFSEQFHGICISADFGGATVLNVAQVVLDLHYHYTYQKAGNDTTISAVKTFYANDEVRQVNHVQYADLQYEQLLKENDSVNYILSPAGLYTEISFPMSMMAKHITDYLVSVSPDIQKRPYVNRALLKIDVIYQYKALSKQTRDDWGKPATYMLLVKEDDAIGFFVNMSLPSDTCAIVSMLTQGTDSVGNPTYYYQFDMAELLTRQLRQTDQPDTLKMVLMPVNITTATNSSRSIVVTSIKPQQTISATTIRSAQAKDNNMSIEVVYSGF